MTRADHTPVGKGKSCTSCKLPRAKHRPSHNPKCSVCGLPAYLSEHSDASHAPTLLDDNLCAECRVPAAQHRVKHHPDGRGPGGECSCGASLGNHKLREMSPSDRRRHNERTYQERQYFIGIDGEGQGREDHKYVMLAASDGSGTKRWHVEVPPGKSPTAIEWTDAQGKINRHYEGEATRGLSTVECLEFLLGLPNNARAFSYGFNYDITKILTDVDDETLYLLFRPELRKSKPFWKKGKRVQPLPKPVTWNGYSLNLVGTCFTVAKGNRERVVWDIFKFFQGKFVNSLIDWKVGEANVLERMRFMKEMRSAFDTLPRDQIRNYCLEECAYLSQLAEKLTAAHEEAKLHLKRYYGAGSTAAAILDRMGIKDQKRTADPPEMQIPIAAAFFGGRFENSVAGPVKGPIYNYDLSSAYPYQLYFLPCLGCGKWRHTTKREDIDGATAALVHYKLGPKPAYRHHPTPAEGISWGPFPFRLKDGTIAFPATSGGGWIWRDEYVAGERLFTHVEFREAWVYDCTCDHLPFAEIPTFYLERLRLGKEGAGIVLKLGPNSVYGKLAQSIGGEPPFQSWVWAGMITSGTRAQILDVVGLHKNPADVLMIATDGVASRELINPPKPRDTGTFNGRDWTDGDWAPKDKKHVPVGDPCTVCGLAENMHGKLKPLGGWEMKVYAKGIFLARPGIYFPLDPTEDEINLVRARGIGRKHMYEGWRAIVKAWEDGDEIVRLANVPRFWGGKSSIAPTRILQEVATPAEAIARAKRWEKGLVTATTKVGVAINGDPRVVEGVVTDITTDSLKVAGTKLDSTSVQSFAIDVDDPRPGQLVTTATSEGDSIVWRVVHPTAIREDETLGRRHRKGVHPKVLVVSEDPKQGSLVIKGSLLGFSNTDLRVAHPKSERTRRSETTLQFKHISMVATKVEGKGRTLVEESLSLMEKLVEVSGAGRKNIRTRPLEVDSNRSGIWNAEVTYQSTVSSTEIWNRRRHLAFRRARVVLKHPLRDYREHIDGTLEVIHGRPFIAHHPYKSAERLEHIPVDERFEQIALYDVVCLRSRAYGQWRNQAIELQFNPQPKRDRINPDGTLGIRSFPQTSESMPYDAAIVSPEARAFKEVTARVLEQPDPGSTIDYEDDGGPDLGE